MSADELASCTAAPLTIAGYGLGTTVGFERRVRAAAEAGFVGLGLRAEEYLMARREEHLSDADVQAILDHHGVALAEVEYITGWGGPPDRHAAQREKERTVFHMARRFGVGHVNVGLLEEVPEEHIADPLRALCGRAGDLLVAVEFMPYSAIPDLAAMGRILEAAGCDDAAVIIDAWHWARAGMTADDLQAVPSGSIITIQLCDVLPEPMNPLRSESLHHRLPPGQGFGDVRGMLDALAAYQARPRVISVEIISDQLLSRGVDVAARTAFETAQQVLCEAPIAMPIETPGQRRKVAKRSERDGTQLQARESPS